MIKEFTKQVNALTAANINLEVWADDMAAAELDSGYTAKVYELRGKFNLVISWNRQREYSPINVTPEQVADALTSWNK